MKKTVIKSTGFNSVRLAYDHILYEDRIVINYSAHKNGGYVDCDGKQVLDPIKARRRKLHWSGNAPLVELIRKEYNTMRLRAKTHFS